MMHRNPFQIFAFASLAVAIFSVASAASADQVIDDDLIVQGSACVGQDCVNGEAFGDDTVRIKENNLRIAFDDTSAAPGAPSNTWRITANSSTNGGRNRFSIDDIDADVVPFRGVAGEDISADNDDTSAVALGSTVSGSPFDVVAANRNQPNRIYLNNGTTAPFEGVTGSDITSDNHDSTGIVLTDLNGDGRLDVAAGNFGQTNRLYLNDGSGDPFDTATGSDISADAHDTVAIAAAQLRSFMGPDLVVANEGQPLRIYLNNNSADPFAGVVGSDITSDTYTTTSLALRDVNGDFFADVITGNMGENNRLYLHTGGAAPFSSAVGVDLGSETDDTTSVEVGDVNGDTFADVVVGNRGQPNRLYLGDGSATPFASSAAIDITSDGDDTESIALIDLNGDGLLDVIAGNGGERDRVYLNNGDPVDPFAGVAGSDLEPTARDTRAVVGAVIPTNQGSTPFPTDYLVLGSFGEANVSLLNDDRDGGTSPLTIEAGAPSDSLLVLESGAVAIGTDSASPATALELGGDLVVSGRLQITGDARSGIVRKSAFSKKGIAKVDFGRPYERPYTVLLSAVSKSTGAKFRPIVTKVWPDGFEFALGGSKKDLVEYHWSTRQIGEY